MLITNKNEQILKKMIQLHIVSNAWSQQEDFDINDDRIEKKEKSWLYCEKKSKSRYSKRKDAKISENEWWLILR